MAEAHQSGSERLPGATGVKSPETELHQITQGNVESALCSTEVLLWNSMRQIIQTEQKRDRAWVGSLVTSVPGEQQKLQ